MKRLASEIADDKPVAMLTVGELRSVISAELRGPAGTDGVTTPESPFAAVTHNRITRRRIAKGQPGAWIVGRKHYLSPEALQEELGAVSRQRVQPKRDQTSIADDLAHAVAFVAVGGGRR